MPDIYGFDELGLAVRCIDCPTGGPLYKWPERERRRHARSHGRDRQAAAEQSKELLAVINGLVEEHGEVTT